MYGFSSYGRITSPDSAPSSPADGTGTGGTGGAGTGNSTPSVQSATMDGLEPAPSQQTQPAQSAPQQTPQHQTPQQQQQQTPGTPVTANMGAPDGTPGVLHAPAQQTQQTQQASHSQQQHSPPQLHTQHTLAQPGQQPQTGQQPQQGQQQQGQQQQQSQPGQQQHGHHQPGQSGQPGSHQLYPPTAGTFAPPPPPHMNGMYFSGGVWGSALDPALEFSRAHQQHSQHPQHQSQHQQQQPTDPLLMFPMGYNSRRRDARFSETSGQNHFVHTHPSPTDRKYEQHSAPTRPGPSVTGSGSGSGSGSSGQQYRENGLNHDDPNYDYGGSYEYYGNAPGAPGEYRYPTAQAPTIDGYVPPRLRPAPSQRLWDEQYTNGFHEWNHHHAQHQHQHQQGSHSHSPSMQDQQLPGGGMNSLGLGLVHSNPGAPAGHAGGSMPPPLANHSKNGPPSAGPSQSGENKSPTRRMASAPTTVSPVNKVRARLPETTGGKLTSSDGSSATTAARRSPAGTICRCVD